MFHYFPRLRQKRYPIHPFHHPHNRRRRRLLLDYDCNFDRNSVRRAYCRRSRYHFRHHHRWRVLVVLGYRNRRLVSVVVVRDIVGDIVVVVVVVGSVVVVVPAVDVVVVVALRLVR